jgi:hypothetical protein
MPLKTVRAREKVYDFCIIAPDLAAEVKFLSSLEEELYIIIVG